MWRRLKKVKIRRLGIYLKPNFFGALALSKKVIPHMRARGSGRIINNSSQAGLMANPWDGYYSASKYALEGLMEVFG